MRDKIKKRRIELEPIRISVFFSLVFILYTISLVVASIVNIADCQKKRREQKTQSSNQKRVKKGVSK